MEGARPKAEFHRIPGRFLPAPDLVGEPPGARRRWLFNEASSARQIDTRDLSRFLVVTSTAGWLAQDFSTQDGAWAAEEWRAGFFYGGGIYSDSGIDVYKQGRYCFSTKERHYPLRLMLEHVRRHPEANPPEVRIAAAGPSRIAAALRSTLGMPRRIVRLLTGTNDTEHLYHLLTGYHRAQDSAETGLAALAQKVRNHHWLRVAPPGWRDPGPEAHGLLRVAEDLPADAAEKGEGFPSERSWSPGESRTRDLAACR